MSHRLPSQCVPLPLVLLALFSGLGAQEQAPLTPGQSFARTLEVGETHEYILSLDSAWFASGRVDQESVRVTVTISDPDGGRIGRFGAGVGTGGPESFSFVSPKRGLFRIEVAAEDPEDLGSYRIQLDRLEAAATTPGGKVDQAMAIFHPDTPGALAAVIREGEVRFIRSYGAANLTHGIPFSEETVTNIGSTSKQFTGFAMALLQQRGVLSLDDDVRLHIPELPDFGEVVTLRHLLSHTSGYREFVNLLALEGRQVLEGDHIAREEILEVVQRQPCLQNAPGGEFNYNNTAFGLLTMVLERVTGRSFPQWMAEEVFEPLGMRNTHVRADPGQVLPGSAQGYLPGVGGFREVRDLGVSMGAGGIYTTAGDLARWMGNLGSGELGGPEVIRELTTPFVLTGGDTTRYGLGLFIDTNRGLSRWQHGGSDVAHRSTFVYYPELNAGYVVLSNYGAIPGSISSTVAEAFFGEHMSPPAGPGARAAAAPADQEARVPSELLEAYSGRFELAAMPGVVLTISHHESGLFLQAADQPELRLRATSDSTFAVETADISITFLREPDGEVRALILHQNGDHEARRLPEVKEEMVDLWEYEGRYFSQELETFYVLRVEEDTLRIHHRRFGPVPLTHSRDETFTGAFPVTDIQFERDEEGRVSGFRAGNGRARDVWFERR